jgi:transcriptional regulator with XRE-family HTH domain
MPVCRIQKRVPSYTKPSMAARIRDVRKDRAMSQAELARLVDVAPRTVSNWENAGVHPRPKNLSNIAETLEQTEIYFRMGLFKLYPPTRRRPKGG